jgi:dihydromethanopterin reductase (acceptor)
MTRFAWGITGAGHFLADCAELIPDLPEVDLFLSRAAEEVVCMYGLEEQLLQGSRRLYRESRARASAPQIARFFRGDYDCLVVAPATGNTVAKFAYGIADSLISNLFAQAGKSRVPIIVLPTDVAPVIDSPGPKGRLVKVFPRPVDLEAIARLRSFPGVTVVCSIPKLRRALELGA